MKMPNEKEKLFEKLFWEENWVKFLDFFDQKPFEIQRIDWRFIILFDWLDVVNFDKNDSNNFEILHENIEELTKENYKMSWGRLRINKDDNLEKFLDKIYEVFVYYK